MNNFNAVYGAAVDVFIDRFTERRIMNRKWAIASGLCMQKAEYYKIPEIVVELLNIGTIHKPYAHVIQLKIHSTVTAREGMFNSRYCTFLDECVYCGAETYSEHGYVWTYNEGTLCDSCYNENPIYDSNMYHKVDVTQYNATDYVQFAKNEIREKYFVNCNTASDKYGSIVCINQGWDSWGMVMYPNVIHFLKAVSEWLEYMPMPINWYTSQWDIILNRKVTLPGYAIIYGFPDDASYSDIISRLDYVCEFSEELVLNCMKLFEHRKNLKRILNKRSRQRVGKMNNSRREEYIRTMLKKREGQRMFSEEFIENICGLVVNINVNNTIYKNFSFYALKDR